MIKASAEETWRLWWVSYHRARQFQKLQELIPVLRRDEAPRPFQAGAAAFNGTLDRGSRLTRFWIFFHSFCVFNWVFIMAVHDWRNFSVLHRQVSSHCCLLESVNVGRSEHVMSHNHRRADARAWLRPSQEPTSSCWNLGASLPLSRLKVAFKCAFKCALPASVNLTNSVNCLRIN